MSDEQATPVGHEAQLAALEAAARDRWGEHWTIRILQFSEGSIQAFAFHSNGRTDEGHLEHERLVPASDTSDDEFVVVRYVFDPEQELEEEVLYDPRSDTDIEAG